MEWVPVKSKMLVAIAYSSEWQQLYLKFRPGDVYCYRGVPSARYQELLAADSKGTYARDNILHCYPYQRIYVADGPEDQVRSAEVGSKGSIDEFDSDEQDLQPLCP